jgi:hypothetical protein
MYSLSGNDLAPVVLYSPGMSTPPNILVICTDQQRADTIHALGNDLIKTPALDRLVRDGTAFTRAYTPAPMPARQNLPPQPSAASWRAARSAASATLAPPEQA